MQKELEELLHRHREKMVICCEETCLCWDVEALLAKHEAAQQSVQSTKARCICVDFLNNNPDPTPNPDCPVHGAGFRG